MKTSFRTITLALTLGAAMAGCVDDGMVDDNAPLDDKADGVSEPATAGYTAVATIGAHVFALSHDGELQVIDERDGSASLMMEGVGKMKAMDASTLFVLGDDGRVFRFGVEDGWHEFPVAPDDCVDIAATAAEEPLLLCEELFHNDTRGIFQMVDGEWQATVMVSRIPRMNRMEASIHGDVWLYDMNSQGSMEQVLRYRNVTGAIRPFVTEKPIKTKFRALVPTDTGEALAYQMQYGNGESNVFHLDADVGFRLKDKDVKYELSPWEVVDMRLWDSVPVLVGKDWVGHYDDDVRTHESFHVSRFELPEDAGELRAINRFGNRLIVAGENGVFEITSTGPSWLL